MNSLPCCLLLLLPLVLVLLLLLVVLLCSCCCRYRHCCFLCQHLPCVAAVVAVATADKAINHCKAILKAMSFDEQKATLDKVDKNVERQWDFGEDGVKGVEDLSLGGAGDLARPVIAGQGHMAVWAVF